MLDGDDEQTLSARVLAQEHRIYPQAVRWFAGQVCAWWAGASNWMRHRNRGCADSASGDRSSLRCGPYAHRTDRCLCRFAGHSCGGPVRTGYRTGWRSRAPAAGVLELQLTSRSVTCGGRTGDPPGKAGQASAFSFPVSPSFCNTGHESLRGGAELGALHIYL